ncbi:MarR family transcriptional regulator [candidate division KSB1 bacterium]|nr:MarR family transcriptional regulator [candidate division KSB1 bacterium]
MNHIFAKSQEFQRFLNKLNSNFTFCDNQVLQKHRDLSRQELNIVNALGQLGSMQMRELAEQQMMPMSTLTGVMDRLAQKSIVVRKRSPKDKRIIKVSLASNGEKVFRLLQEQRLVLTRNLMGTLKSEEQDILLLLSRKMRRDLIS